MVGRLEPVERLADAVDDPPVDPLQGLPLLAAGEPELDHRIHFRNRKERPARRPPARDVPEFARPIEIAQQTRLRHHSPLAIHPARPNMSVGRQPGRVLVDDLVLGERLDEEVVAGEFHRRRLSRSVSVASRTWTVTITTTARPLQLYPNGLGQCEASFTGMRPKSALLDRFEHATLDPRRVKLWSHDMEQLMLYRLINPCA